MFKAFFTGFNYWPWVALLILMGALYGAHRHYVGIAVQQNTVQIEQRYKTQFDKAEAEAKTTEVEIRVNANNLRKDKDATIKEITADLASANERLRQRTKRPIGQDIPASVGQSCTGRELYQEDGLFLRGEAARAEALIAERDYYYNAYEDARKKLDGRTNETSRRLPGWFERQGSTGPQEP